MHNIKECHLFHNPTYTYIRNKAMVIEVTKHFVKRFRERVARSGRAALFAERAYLYGYSLGAITDKELRLYLSNSEADHCTSARVYQNFVYWFCGNRAITVYCLPYQYRRQLNKSYITK